MSKFHIAAAALIAAGTAAAPALALAQAPDRNVRTVTVASSDLNLTTPAGQATLRHRIVAAVRTVCGEGDIRELAVTADMVACRNASLAQATAAMRQLVAAAEGQRTVTLALGGPN